MVFVNLCCQICLCKSSRVCDFKKHILSPGHALKVKEVFQQDVTKKNGFLPFICLLDPQLQDSRNPIVGVSLLTLCLCSDSGTRFYLCHSCEETCAFNSILDHLSSGDHYSNYFNYMDPNALNFSWIAGMDMRKNLWTQLTNEMKKKEHLQILYLPGNLNKFKSSTYLEVMNTLRENDKLLKLFEAVLPKRTTIQTYQRDSNRKHPLLGLQHLVEWICVGSSEKSHYICTLCSLTVASHMIIKHVLSFDHIFCYFKAWHPSTLLSKESHRKYSKFFASSMLNLSKQSEQVHGTADTDIKQVSLEPDDFKLVNSTCYTEALKKLETITSSSLITTVTPGTKLECSIATPPSTSLYKIRCQNCNIMSQNIFQYIHHLSHWSHKMNLKKYFGEAEGFDHETAKFHLGLYSYIQDCSEPVVGAHLVVTCITTQVVEKPIYVCFACQDCFPQWCLDKHFTSQKHLIHTLLYQNPWRLPFAWEDHLDGADLMVMAQEEENERRPDQMTLKVFDIPNKIIKSFTPLSYSKVLEGLELQHFLLKRDVPPCKTYSKLQQNERFPLLGKQFLVCWYNDDGQRQQSGSLCLLCKRLLSDIESHAHVFSREHVAAFLDRFHPGSLNSSTDNAEIFLDLAKQAARIHPILHVQVIILERPIREPCSYFTAIRILQAAKKNRGNGSLEPPIKPKMKLVPRKTVKEVDKDRVRNSPKSSSDSSKLCVESGKDEENKDGKMTPTPSEDTSKMKSEGFSSSEETKNADKTCQAIKEKTEEPTVRKPGGEIPESSQSKGRDDGAEKSESSKEVQAQLKNDVYKDGKRKRPSSMSETSEKTTCPNEDMGGEKGHKRQRFTSHEDTVYEKPPKMPSSDQKLEKTADVEKSVKAPVNKGSSTLQCCCDQRKPDHLCEYCSLKISNRDVIGHVTGVHQQETHVVVDMEIDDSEDSQAAADMSVMTDTTFKTTPESDKEDTMTHNKVPESTDNTHTCLTVPRSSEESPNVSTSGKNTACLPPDSTFSDCKAFITPKTTVASFKVTNTSKREDVTAATSKCTAASPKRRASTSTATSLNATPTTKSAAVSRPPESRTGVASKAKATSCNVAPTSQKRSTVVCEAACRPAPSSKTGNPPKCSEAVSFSEMPKASGKCGNSETSAKTVHVKHSGVENADDGPRVHKLTQPTAPHLATATTDKKRSIEPTSASNAKPKKGIPKVGSNHLVLVSCEGKQQIYCLLCSVKLTHSSDIHSTDRKHQLNYLKLRYPEQSLNLSNSQLQNIVRNLAKVEKDLESQKIQKKEVNKAVYDELRALPLEKALEKLKEILGKRYTPASSSFTAENLRRDAAGASPCEVSSTDDDSHVGEEASVAATRLVRAQSFDHEVTQADGLMQDQLRPSSRLNENYPEPNPGPSIPSEDKRVVNREKLVTDTSRENPDSRQQQRRSNAELQATQKMLEGKKTQGCSRLSAYLKVKKLDAEPVIGLGSVWECQGVSQKTFFLCESCRKMLFLSDICQHMVSSDHQLQCMRSKHDKILSLFWHLEDITWDLKWKLFSEAVMMISDRERFTKIDAQVVLLGQELYESVQTAPFSEAVEIVQNIKNENTRSAFCLPTSTSAQNNQQLEDRQSLEESLPTEMQPAEALETNQRSDNTEVFPTEARQTPEKPCLDETSMAEDLNGAKERRVLSPLVGRCFSLKADPVVCPSPSASTCLSPQEAYNSLSVKRSTSPPPRPQSPLPLVQVKQEVLDLESPSFATVNPEVSQTLSVSPEEKSLLTRKRPADTPVETLISFCSFNPPEELPANCTPSLLQPITRPGSGSASESTVINPVTTPAPLSYWDKDTEPKSDQQNSFTRACAFDALIALVRDSKKTMSSCKFSLDVKAVSSCVTSFSENMEKNCDLKRVKTESEACDSTTTTATCYENQIVTNANSASSASKSSSEDYLARGSPFFGATEGNTAGTIVPSATTADQPSYAATNHTPGQILKPQSDTKTKMTGVFSLPINTIITDRPKTTKLNKFMGSYKVENPTEMNTGQQVSLSTLQTSPSQTLAASGGHGQYSHSIYLASEAVSGYTAPSNPAIHTGSLYQRQEYTRMQLYPSQLYPEQGVGAYSLQSFGNSLATPIPTGWRSLEIQQPQQQQLMQQQLMQQQQHQMTTDQQLQQLQQQLQQLQQEVQQLQPQPQTPQQQLQQLQQQQPEQPEQQQQVQEQQYLAWTRT